jgi:putative ABC transport system permease protein
VENPADIRRLPTLREELLQTGAVNAASEAAETATDEGDRYAGYQWPGKDPAVVGEFATVGVSAGYGAMIGWSMKEGRDFSPDFATDSEAVVINEAAVAFMALKHPLGEKITYWNGKHYTVIGVVRNVVMGSLYEPPAKTVYMPIYGVEDYASLAATISVLCEYPLVDLCRHGGGCTGGCSADCQLAIGEGGDG